MPTPRVLAIAVLLAATGVATAQDKTKRLYCWTENGRKVCEQQKEEEGCNTAGSRASASRPSCWALLFVAALASARRRSRS